MKNRLKVIAVRNLILLGAVLLFLLMAALTDFSCPLFRILKIPCPTCGVTRAMFALLRLDLTAYVHYQPLALPLCVAVWLMLNVDLWKHKRAAAGFAIAVAAVNVFFWIYRLHAYF